MFRKIVALIVTLSATAVSGMCSEEILPPHAYLSSDIFESKSTTFNFGVLLFPEGFDISKIIKQPGIIWEPIHENLNIQNSQIERKVADMTRILESATVPQPNATETLEVIDPIARLVETLAALEDTLAIAMDPSKLCALAGLPLANKMMLLDLSERLVEEGKAFTELKSTLLEQFREEQAVSFDTSAETIGWGYQIDQHYKMYTHPEHSELIFSLIHCFVVSKGYEIRKLNPPIAIEDLEILIKNAVDYSGYEGHSPKLLELAKQLETLMG